MDFTSLLGYIASFVGVVSLLPQVIRCYKRKHTKDISMATYSILCLATALWTWYGILRGDWPVIITNGLIFLLGIAMVSMKLKYG